MSDLNKKFKLDKKDENILIEFEEMYEKII
jgi:hypothetical protein